MWQELKDQLLGTYQSINESLLAFYTTIRRLIDLTGYTDVIKDHIAETALMTGLHKEIAVQVRSSPTTLTLAQKVDYAHRYWVARNPAASVLSQTLAPHLRRTFAESDEVPYVAPDVKNPGTWKPAQFRSPTERKLDELTEQMAKMSAHIMNQDRRGERRPPIQRFSAQPATGSNATPATCRRCNQQGHWINQYPEPDKRTCFKCGEQGHIATWCRSKTNRPAQPNQQMRSQQQQGSNSRSMQSNVVNFDVREIFPDEDPTEYYPAETRRQPGRPRKNAAPYTQNKGKAPVTIKPRPKPTIKEVNEFNQNI